MGKIEEGLMEGDAPYLYPSLIQTDIGYNTAYPISRTEETFKDSFFLIGAILNGYLLKKRE